MMLRVLVVEESEPAQAQQEESFRIMLVLALCWCESALLGSGCLIKPSTLQL